jgi:hypothetical protein
VGPTGNSFAAIEFMQNFYHDYVLYSEHPVRFAVLAKSLLTILRSAQRVDHPTMFQVSYMTRSSQMYIRLEAGDGIRRDYFLNTMKSDAQVAVYDRGAPACRLSIPVGRIHPTFTAFESSLDEVTMKIEGGSKVVSMVSGIDDTSRADDQQGGPRHAGQDAVFQMKTMVKLQAEDFDEFQVPGYGVFAAFPYREARAFMTFADSLRSLIGPVQVLLDRPPLPAIFSCRDPDPRNTFVADLVLATFTDDSSTQAVSSVQATVPSTVSVAPPLRAERQKERQLEREREGVGNTPAMPMSIPPTLPSAQGTQGTNTQKTITSSTPAMLRMQQHNSSNSYVSETSVTAAHTKAVRTIPSLPQPDSPQADDSFLEQSQSLLLSAGVAHTMWNNSNHRSQMSLSAVDYTGLRLSSASGMLPMAGSAVYIRADQIGKRLRSAREPPHQSGSLPASSSRQRPQETEEDDDEYVEATPPPADALEEVLGAGGTSQWPSTKKSRVEF